MATKTRSKFEHKDYAANIHRDEIGVLIEKYAASWNVLGNQVLEEAMMVLAQYKPLAILVLEGSRIQAVRPYRQGCSRKCRYSETVQTDYVEVGGLRSESRCDNCSY